METLILIGLVSGIVTALSPCVLPILPVVLVASTTPGEANPNRWRPFVVILGLIASFSVFTLIGSALLTLLGLPQDLLRWIGIVVLLLAGLGLLIPKAGELIERPFARIPMRKLDRNGPAFIVGLGLGLVFVPCAGPVLAAITVLSASGSIDLKLVALTISFAIGVAIPLLFFAMAGQRMGERIRAFRTRASLIRHISGAILMVMALALALNVTAVFQRLVPSYVSAVQDSVENSDAARNALGSLSGTHDVATFDECANNPSTLGDCGAAPDFAGIDQWFNTANGAPLTLSSLRGKVVLVDFWTYSCINCQRTLPTITKWDQAYRDAGLVVVGVHTPEFPFEKVPDNIKSAIGDFGIKYPVAVDNDYATWNAYGNRYWPAHYLIDSTGEVRQVHYGEGAYSETEQLIRQLLTAANPTAVLPAPINAQDDQLTAGRTPETYLGYQRMSGLTNGDLVMDKAAQYSTDDQVERDHFTLGGQWTVTDEYAQAGDEASLAFHIYAAKAYVVVSGEGTLGVSSDHGVNSQITVSGAPKLYTLTSGAATDQVLTLRPSPGLRLYSFTFG